MNDREFIEQVCALVERAIDDDVKPAGVVEALLRAISFALAAIDPDNFDPDRAEQHLKRAVPRVVKLATDAQSAGWVPLQ